MVGDVPVAVPGADPGIAPVVLRYGLLNEKPNCEPVRFALES